MRFGAGGNRIVSEWVAVCRLSEAPEEGAVLEAEAAGVSLCLARLNGDLHALDNLCPHRAGPLGQGWIEGNAVVCPWHAWAFNLHSGIAEPPEPPEHARVRVYPVRTTPDELQVNLALQAEEPGQS